MAKTAIPSGLVCPSESCIFPGKGGSPLKKCKCTLLQRLTGDGCDICRPGETIKDTIEQIIMDYCDSTITWNEKKEMVGGLHQHSYFHDDASPLEMCTKLCMAVESILKADQAKRKG